MHQSNNLHSNIDSSSANARRLTFGQAQVEILSSVLEIGSRAAEDAAAIINAAFLRRGCARIVVATGNSQLAFIDALVQRPDIDWNSVDVFHMDEYVSISPNHPSSFRRWIRERVADKVHPRQTHYLAANSHDLDAELQRYAFLLSADTLDLAFVGFGENGHIAFNDPPVADFDDPAVVKRVVLDEACRRQQLGEGHFPDLDSVPKEALTVTCPGLFRAAAWICSVPELRKAKAVRNALTGPISTTCPASLVRTHPHAKVYLDQESSSLLHTL